MGPSFLTWRDGRCPSPEKNDRHLEKITFPHATYFFPVTACNESWTPPQNWPIGDLPAVYRHFENNACLELMAGTSVVLETVSVF